MLLNEINIDQDHSSFFKGSFSSPSELSLSFFLLFFSSSSFFCLSSSAFLTAANKQHPMQQQMRIGTTIQRIIITNTTIIIVVVLESSKWRNLSVSTPREDSAKLLSCASDYDKSFYARLENFGSTAYNSIGSPIYFFCLLLSCCYLESFIYTPKT